MSKAQDDFLDELIRAREETTEISGGQIEIMEKQLSQIYLVEPCHTVHLLFLKMLLHNHVTLHLTAMLINLQFFMRMVVIHIMALL